MALLAVIKYSMLRGGNKGQDQEKGTWWPGWEGGAESIGPVFCKVSTTVINDLTFAT